MLTVVVRTVIVYALLIFAMRLMGKRQLGELQPSELVTTILISNLASLPIEETDLPIMTAILPIFIIVCLEIILSVLEIKSARFSKFVSGSAKTIIRDGIIDQSVMSELRYSVEDLLEALRGKDVYDINDVEYGVIETNGQLNIYKKFGKQAAANERLNIEQDIPSRPPVAIIIDGKLQKGALVFCKKDEGWLTGKLEEFGILQKEIMLMQCNTTGECHVVTRRI